ncbi:hypothetical protein ABVT39_017686 [Epinephelus coioides]
MVQSVNTSRKGLVSRKEKRCAPKTIHRVIHSIAAAAAAAAAHKERGEEKRTMSGDKTRKRRVTSRNQGETGTRNEGNANEGNANEARTGHNGDNTEDRASPTLRSLRKVMSEVVAEGIRDLKSEMKKELSQNYAGCLQLSQKITELEGRISTIYQIQDSERLLDYLAAEASRLANNNTTLPWPGPPHLSDMVQLIVGSIQEYDQDWPRLETIQLGNRFEALGKLNKNPPNGLEPPASPVRAPLRRLPSGLAGASARRSGAAGHRAPLRPSSSKARSPAPPGEPQRLQPTTLVIGDSIIRNVRSRSALTCCFPGATVRDITTKAAELITSSPGITTVIIHAGTNDIHKQQSELLKIDFVHLITTLQRAVNHVHISGPIPSCGRGCRRFNRLLALHTWLLSACTAHGVNYIDNFNLFWSRRELFRGDGVHPNWLGATMLTGNIFHSVHHPRVSHHSKQSTSPPSTPSNQSIYY